jgi:hypothetical protein
VLLLPTATTSSGSAMLSFDEEIKDDMTLLLFLLGWSVGRLEDDNNEDEDEDRYNKLRETSGFRIKGVSRVEGEGKRVDRNPRVAYVWSSCVCVAEARNKEKVLSNMCSVAPV